MSSTESRVAGERRLIRDGSAHADQCCRVNRGGDLDRRSGALDQAHRSGARRADQMMRPRGVVADFPLSDSVRLQGNLSVVRFVDRRPYGSFSQYASYQQKRDRINIRRLSLEAQRNFPRHSNASKNNPVNIATKRKGATRLPKFGTHEFHKSSNSLGLQMRSAPIVHSSSVPQRSPATTRGNDAVKVRTCVACRCCAGRAPHGGPFSVGAIRY